MTDNLEALIPGGGMVAASLGLLGWFVKSAKDDRTEWRELLKTEREGRVRDLADERARHDAALQLEHGRAEKVKTTTDAVEADLRRRIADAETAARGWQDEAADAQRRASHWRAEYTRVTGATGAGELPGSDLMPDPYGRRRGGAT